MKVRLDTVIKDPQTSRELGLKKPYEGFDPARDEIFLDGPTCRRVAVIDFEPGTGALSPPVPFLPVTRRRKIGRYKILDRADVHAIDMMKVSVFGAVLKTMKMYEEADNLGRKLTWAFDAPQLLVVPRAGQWNNAFYERDSHSLQLFYFPSVRDPQLTVFTALSHDIVTHETGHAIFDGIAPDLYNAVSPQSLAMHEAIADLTALLMAFRLKSLREAVLEEKGGSIEESSGFSGIAAEFASERDPNGRHLFLRNLNNKKSLNPSAGENHVSTVEPHELSEVLGGTLYAVLKKMYQARWKKNQALFPDKTPLKLSGESLFAASEQFKRMVLRALDYLPPGEASFADLGRAIIASDQASYPESRDARARDWFVHEFVKRKLVASRAELDVTLPEKDRQALEKYLASVDLEVLVSSDWAAYEFVNCNRRWLGIPDGISFHIRPRLDVTKKYLVSKKSDTKKPGYKQMHVRECILKVKWDQQEPSGLGQGYPHDRRISVGTTLSIEWKDRKIRARLTSDASDGQRADRDELLRGLVDDDILKFDGAALGPDGRPLPSAIRAETVDGVMAVRGSARLLHLASGRVLIPKGRHE